MKVKAKKPHIFWFLSGNVVNLFFCQTFFFQSNKIWIPMFPLDNRLHYLYYACPKSLIFLKQDVYQLWIYNKHDFWRQHIKFSCIFLQGLISKQKIWPCTKMLHKFDKNCLPSVSLKKFMQRIVLFCVGNSCHGQSFSIKRSQKDSKECCCCCCFRVGWAEKCEGWDLDELAT